MTWQWLGALGLATYFERRLEHLLFVLEVLETLGRIGQSVLNQGLDFLTRRGCAIAEVEQRSHIVEGKARCLRRPDKPQSLAPNSKGRRSGCVYEANRGHHWPR